MPEINSKQNIIFFDDPEALFMVNNYMEGSDTIK